MAAKKKGKKAPKKAPKARRKEAPKKARAGAKSAPRVAKKAPAPKRTSIQEARAQRMLTRSLGCSTAGADLAMCRWG